jgi:transposase
MASRDMLEEDFGISLPLDKIYRMMDSLDHKAIPRLKDITYQNTLNLLGGKISVIFYDATTLYFESFDSDELKKCGFSKDSKHNQPQVLFALMVTSEGLPIDYEVFPGNIYEGKTLIPALEKISQKYNIEKVVLVADSAMLSEANILKLDSLKDKAISYIVGARLKSLPEALKKKILDTENYQEVEPGYLVACFNYKGKKLVVSYSSRRAKKDDQDRIKALEKLEAKLQKSKNPKSHLSKAGYRKYLKLEGKSEVSLDEDKIATDRAWDGLGGVITNSDLAPEEILTKYRDLFTVEDAFRLTKHDLKIRPIFHWKPRRIRAHIALCFVAYALVKQMEHRIRLQYRKLSPEKIRQALVRVQTSILFDKVKRIRYGLPSRLSHDARKIYDILQIKKTITPYIIKKL